MNNVAAFEMPTTVADEQVLPVHEAQEVFNGRISVYCRQAFLA